MRRVVAKRGVAARRDDGGFSIVEVVVAIAVVTIVMTSLAGFFVNSGRVTDYQDQRQTASQVAESAMDKARALVTVATPGPLRNRDCTTSNAQWNDALTGSDYPGVASYLSNFTMACDTTGGLSQTAGYTAPLPICIPNVTPAATCASSGATFALGSRTYTRSWFIGTCNLNGGGNCDNGQGQGQSPFEEFVVAVTWTDKSCANNLCSYITATDINQAQDPVFDQSHGAPKPILNNPGNQTTEAGQTVSLPITVSGGTNPFTWTSPALPAGLVWAATPTSASITGTPTTATATPMQVMLQVTDKFGYVSTAAFTWTITPAPSFPAISDQSLFTGTAITTIISTVSGGVGPYTWSATNLPPGVTIKGYGATATISGTPTTPNYYTVTVKAVDANNVPAVQTFHLNTWVYVTFGAAGCINDRGVYHCTWTATATGTGPYKWSTNDPAVQITPSADTLSATFSVDRAKGTYVVQCTVAMNPGPQTSSWNNTEKAGTA